MSFTTNTSNLSGKSTTNAFDIVANSLTVNKNTLCKGDLTVLGTTNIGNVTLENGFVNNLTVNNFTATNPVPIASGGTGLATLGTANQVLTVNPAGTALIYAPPGLINPATITGTGFTGNPTLSLGLEADTGSLGRGFIRTGVAAVNGLFLGTASATVLRLWSNFATDSNAEIINTNANFTYNSTGSSGVYQVLSGGGGISFTNSGIGTISMATSAGNLSLAAGAGTISLTTGIGSTTITTGAGPISLTTGAGNISLTTAATGIISLTTATAGAINIGANVGLVNLYGSGITLGAPFIYIGGGNSIVPVLSAVIFACGDVTGVTGFWNITTLAFQLNALSISLNSTGTIALNNNTTIGGYLSAAGNLLANSGNFTSFTTLTPAITVYNFDGYRYGMDLGYNATFGRYRTRIFCPNVGLGDIALSTSIQNATSQSNFTDRLVVRGDTGNIEMYSKVTVTNGNIITNQNIVGGVEIINNGNLALTAASPGNILIRGGSGSIITLPDATTLLVGYIYTINNNSNNPTIVNQHNSGTVGTVPALNAATVTCISTTSPNGQWDIHITGPTVGTDWATPGQIGSAIPNTGVFTTLSCTSNLFVNSDNIVSLTNINPQMTVYNFNGYRYGMDLGYNSTTTRYRTRIFCPNSGSGDIALSTCIQNPTGQSSFTDRFIMRGDTGNFELLSKTTFTGLQQSSNTSSLFTFINTATLPTFTTATLAPNMAVDAALYSVLGSSISNNAYFSFVNSAIPFTSWGLFNSSTIISMESNGNIGLRAPNTLISGNCLVNSDNVANTSTLNPAITIYNSDGYRYGMDLGYNATSLRFRTRIFCPSTGGGDIALSTSIQNPTGQSSFTDRLIVNGSNGEITLAAKTFVNASLSSFTTSIFNVENTSTAPNFTSTVLAPSIAIDLPIFFAVGKSLTSSNAAFLNFTNATVPFSTWSLYNSTTKIDQAYNGNVTITAPTTTVVGNFTATNLKSSSTIYGYSQETPVNINTWTNVDFITVFRQKNPGLTWINQSIGFRNDLGIAVLVNVSFACKRTTNAFGITAIRILGGGGEGLGVQDVTAEDAVSISGNTFVDPGQTIRCQIYQNIQSPSVPYKDIVVSINTTPVFT